MAGQLILEEEVWYLAVQDGRLDDREYDSEAAAKKALKKIPKLSRLGICVMSYIKRTPVSTKLLKGLE